MKTRFLLTLACLFCVTANAKELYPKLPVLSDKQKEKYGTLIPFQSKKGTWGYQDCKGKKVVITPKFESAESYKSDGRAIVQYNSKYGVIDQTIAYIIYPIYDAIERLTIGQSTYYKIWAGQKCGLLSYTGEETLSCEQNNIYKEGEIIIYKTWGGKYGAISTSGQQILPSEQDEIRRDNQILLYKHNGKYGAIDTSGKQIFPCEQDEIKKTEQIIIYSIGNKYGAISTSGKQILPCEQDEIKMDKNLLIYKNNNKYGVYKLIANDGSEMLSCKYDSIQILMKNVGRVIRFKANNMFGVMWDNGTKIFDCKYKKIEFYVDENFQNNIVFGLKDTQGSVYDIAAAYPSANILIAKDIRITNKKGCQCYDSISHSCYYLYGDNIYSLAEYDKFVYSRDNSSDKKNYLADKTFPYKMKLHIPTINNSLRKKDTGESTYYSWYKTYNFVSVYDKYGGGENEYYEWNDGKNIYSDRILYKTLKKDEASNSGREYTAICARNAKENYDYFMIYSQPRQGRPLIISAADCLKKYVETITDSDEEKYRGYNGWYPLKVGYLSNDNIVLTFAFRFDKFYSSSHLMAFCIINPESGKIISFAETPLRANGSLLADASPLKMTISTNGGFYCYKTSDNDYLNDTEVDVIYKYDDEGNLEWSYEPTSYHVFFISEYEGTLLLLGGTTNSGYVGFYNPVVIAINNGEVVKEICHTEKERIFSRCYITNKHLYGIKTYGGRGGERNRWQVRDTIMIKDLDLNQIVRQKTSKQSIPFEMFQMSGISYAGKTFYGCGMKDNNGEWLIPPVYSFYANDSYYKRNEYNQYGGYVIEPYDEKAESVTIQCPNGETFKKQLNPAKTGYINVTGKVFSDNNSANSQTAPQNRQQSTTNQQKETQSTSPNAWIYGKWKCKTPYGSIIIIIKENGKMYNSVDDAWHSYTIESTRIWENCGSYGSSYPLDKSNKRIGTGEPGYWFSKVSE